VISQGFMPRVGPSVLAMLGFEGEYPEPEFVSLRADPRYHLDILSIGPAQPTTR
jgi:hypothetical protein